MIQDVNNVTDPNLTLDWSDRSYIEGKRETGMAVRVTPDSDLVEGDDFAHDLVVFRENMSEYTQENFERIVLSDENKFDEYLSVLYVISKESKLLIGKLCWARLQNTLGWMDASESKQRNSMVGTWCVKIGCEYVQLNNYILAAKAQALIPETSDLTITAAAEIARNAGSGEEEQRETIRERANAVRKLDSGLTNTTATARDVKVMETNGNKKPELYRIPDITEFRHIADQVVMGQIKIGERFDDESGAYEPIYDYFPIARLYFDEPNSEENRPQFDNYKKILLRRWGVRDGA